MGYDLKRQDRTISYAARIILGLKDGDLDSVHRVLTEASTTGGLGGLRDVTVALGQFAADRVTPDDAEGLALMAADRLAAPPRGRAAPSDPDTDS